MGVKFKRQVSIGVYVADFYCAEKKLVIEIDGQQHKTDEVTRISDSTRDNYLAGKGIKTIEYFI